MECKAEEINKLVKACKIGDERAYESLLETLKPILEQISHKFFVPLLRGSINNDKEELMQEARIALYKATLYYDENSGVPFEGFAGMVIKRKLIAFLKSQTTVKSKLLDSAFSLDKEIADMDEDKTSYDLDRQSITCNALELNDPAEVLCHKDRVTAITQSIYSHLTEYEHTIFPYYFIDGVGLGEISKELKVGYKSVDNAVRRIKLKLNKHLYRDEILISA